MRLYDHAPPSPQFLAPDDLSLYLHFPFCSKLCGYCDFHKDVFNRRKEELYFQALATDTELAADEARALWGEELPPLVSVYMGGGTPSLVNPRLFSDWLTRTRALFRFGDDVEFTVEVNPESATAEQLSFFRSVGVNRLSIGVQSFDRNALALLNRRHVLEDTHRAFYLARAVGIENISADIIFALPGQTLAKLQHDLVELIALEPSHISFYQLTIKDNTPLARQVEDGIVTLADDDTQARFYEAGRAFLADRGYARYEVSSFAKGGQVSRHNRRYWTGYPYVALGPSAHGFDGRRRYEIVRDTQSYIDSLLTRRERPLVWDDFTPRRRMIEEILTGLRLTEGVDTTRFEKRWGASVATLFDHAEYHRLLESGHVLVDHRSLRLSENSLALADEITLRLLAA